MAASDGRNGDDQVNQPKVATEAAKMTECLACRGLIDVREGWITMTSDGRIGILCSKCRATVLASREARG